MQNICRFSRRWHQHFYHSAILIDHQRCFQTIISSRGYRRNARGSKSQKTTQTSFDPFADLVGTAAQTPTKAHPSTYTASKDVTVREFEQYGDDEDTRVQVNPNKELDQETSAVWDQIQQLEKELAVLRQGPFGPQSEFMQSLPVEDRASLLKALADEGVLQDEEEDTPDLTEMDRLMEEDEQQTSSDEKLGITLRIPKTHQAYVKRFNKALEAAQEGKQDAQKSLNLWKWYLRCQQKMPDFSNIISERIWRCLWQSQSGLGVRPKHIVVIARDMISAGESLDGDQWLEYIRCLHSSGNTATAVNIWEEHRNSFSKNVRLVSTYYSTGIQLYGALQRPSRAQGIANQILNEGKADPRILIHVISAWANDRSRLALVKAWACYLQMRSLVGHQTDPELLEKVSNVFLDADRPEMALIVFKDMVSQVREGKDRTFATYQNALGDIDTSKDPEIVEDAINRVSLASLLILPREFHNKWFFASWIKKLIGQGRVDAAAMVVELMYERDIQPDPMHLNGIIGAWLRQGSVESMEKGEKLAWDMIHSRISRVQNRVQNRQSQGKNDFFRKVAPFFEIGNIWLAPIRLRRPVSPASAETFALLYIHYQQRMKWDKFENLTRTMLGPAQIQPNIFIFNMWLQSDLRSHSFGRMWEKYEILKNEISSNLDTFATLWDAESMLYRQTWSSEKSQEDFPDHQQLFSELMNWSFPIREPKLRKLTEDFSPEMYSQIIRCFSIDADLAGTICAVHGLHKRFGQLPDETSIRLITSLVVKLLPQSNSGIVVGARGGRKRHSHRVSNSEILLTKVAEIIDNIESKHKIALLESGENPQLVEDPESAIGQELRLDVLTEFMCLALQKATGEQYESMILQTGKAMGVDMIDVKLGDFN